MSTLLYLIAGVAFAIVGGIVCVVLPLKTYGFRVVDWAEGRNGFVQWLSAFSLIVLMWILGAAFTGLAYLLFR